MISLENMLEERPVDENYLKSQVEQMHEETRIYQLKQLRKETGLTQAELAEKIGITQHRISQIENGKITATKVETLQKYLEALGTSLTITAETANGQSLKIMVGTNQTAA